MAAALSPVMKAAGSDAPWLDPAPSRSEATTMSSQGEVWAGAPSPTLGRLHEASDGGGSRARATEAGPGATTETGGRVHASLVRRQWRLPAAPRNVAEAIIRRWRKVVLVVARPSRLAAARHGNVSRLVNRCSRG